MDRKFEEQKARSREITAARRRNNIYGESTDYIIVAFLELGGDGAIYDRAGRITLYGNSAAHNYVITVIKMAVSTDSAVISDQGANMLKDIAAVTGAVPLYCIAREYSRRAKFFDMNHKKIKFIA